MMEFLLNNLGTIIVATALMCIIAAIVVKLVRDKKKGGCAGCNCGCDSACTKVDCSR